LIFGVVMVDVVPSNVVVVVGVVVGESGVGASVVVVGAVVVAWVEVDDGFVVVVATEIVDCVVKSTSEDVKLAPNCESVKVSVGIGKV